MWKARDGIIGLTLAALVALGPGASAREVESERLSADEIEAEVAGNSLVGYWQNAELKQHFAADGTALRQRERREVVAGRWQVDRGRVLLCTEYPKIDERLCFKVHRQGDKLVLFEAESGYPLHATVIPGNILAGVGGATVAARDNGRRPPGTERTELTREDLYAESYVGRGTIHNAHFMAVGEAGPARHRLAGRLSLPAFALQGRLELGHGYEWFPGFDVEVASDAGRLVWGETGLIMPAKPGAALALILGPGKVWSEPGDGGLSRASFPFLLASTASDNAHNGIASFLFDDTGVSALRVQLVQETAPGFQLDAWGQARMRYRPGPPTDGQALLARSARAAEARTPIRPWSELKAADGRALAEGVTAETLSDDLSVAGLIVDGVAYIQPCRTRRGPFPYCQEMRHGASTMTPSLAALPALLHLAEKHGPWVLDLRLGNFVKVTAKHDGWTRVSFADAIDMASGIGSRLPRHLVSDEVMDLRHSFEAASIADKLGWIFRDPDNRAAPGEAFSFREGDILVLSAAMDAFARREEGPETGIWALTEREVLRPIGIDGLPLLHSVEPSGGPGVPPMHFGLYPTVDDVAKLAGLLHAHGQHDGAQQLYRPPLDELLDWSTEKGLATEVGERRYAHGFWLWPYDAAGCRVWLPVSSGSGGQLLVLLPGGMTAFRFADDRRLPVEAMAAVANRVKPFCR